LEKYFRGETSLAEEKELKQYFSTGEVTAEHEIYRALFQEFELEMNETAFSPLKIVIPTQKKIKHVWIRTFALTGIAASLLLLLWIRMPGSADNYAIIGGNRINNSEFAERYTQKKLTKVNQMLARSMKPMQSLEKDRDNMQPLQSVSDMKEKMEEIQNKLQFK
jgi:hypothetical protein